MLEYLNACLLWSLGGLLVGYLIGYLTCCWKSRKDRP